MSRTRRLRSRVVGAAGVSAALAASMLATAEGSSHREAPLIAEDPVVDNTDVYAFQSPDQPDMITIIANYIPLEEPASGPNFWKFGEDAFYQINIENDGTPGADVQYRFKFQTQVLNDDTFLYNTGPITELDDPDYNVRQTFALKKKVGDQQPELVAEGLLTPPVNIGPRSTPDYEELAAAAVHEVGGMKLFAGQRDDPFFVDLGSTFDLLGLRPLNPAHVIPLPEEDGIDTVAGYNTHTIAIQVPIDHVVGDGPTIGVWAEAKRFQTRTFRSSGDSFELGHSGDLVQVSRLGNPLVNEVIIPRGDKDLWNHVTPYDDERFVQYFREPELGTLIPSLYPVFECFPEAPRDDLVALFLFGIPDLNQIPGHTQPAEMLRFNTSLPAGFPNGRLLTDDVVDTSLRAVAGAALPIQECFGMAPNNLLTDGVDGNDRPFLDTFPYVATPHSGYASDENSSIPVPDRDVPER